jgi:hypothetical protein
MTKRKQLGEFYIGAFVKSTSYSMGGSVHRSYGQVTRIDLETQKIYWTRMYRDEVYKDGWVKYPPPRPEEPSSWKFFVIEEKDFPEECKQHIKRRSRTRTEA